ncbi:MAG: hypothetical protein QM731_04920 [Chitinophagaceae bacterium]
MAVKILLIQLYSNGDSLYATAVARQIKQDNPGCHLTWAIASFCKDIIAGNPYVDDVLEVTTVAKNDVVAYRRFRKEMYQQKQQGRWDEIVITNVIDEKQANYDGTIRSATLRGYNKPVTVPLQPVLRLRPEELEKAKSFATAHQLHTYKHIILFEFAPQSKQSDMTPAFAIELSEKITQRTGTAIILSSALKINHTSPQIIDGSSLSLRETAALTHYCTLLLGSSSGITWVSTSDAAKALPMVQVLDPFTPWVNAVSRDFERFHFPADELIEIYKFDKDGINNCIQDALNDFTSAKNKWHQPLPLHFKATRGIVYNLLCYFHFAAIAHHIRVNREVYGNKTAFYKEVAMGFVVLPFWLIRNITRKKILKKK